MLSFILHEIIYMNILTSSWSKNCKEVSCNEEFCSNYLTGFKEDNWDQIFSVWQTGQYRAAVIKPLPVKHSAIIDEFPLGR